MRIHHHANHHTHHAQQSYSITASQYLSIWTSLRDMRIWGFEGLRGVTTGRWKKLFWRRDPCFAAGPLPRRGSLNDRTDWEKRQLWKERTSPPKKVNFYKRDTFFKTRAKESWGQGSAPIPVLMYPQRMLSKFMFMLKDDLLSIWRLDINFKLTLMNKGHCK